MYCFILSIRGFQQPAARSSCYYSIPSVCPFSFLTAATQIAHPLSFLFGKHITQSYLMSFHHTATSCWLTFFKNQDIFLSFLISSSSLCFRTSKLIPMFCLVPIQIMDTYKCGQPSKKQQTTIPRFIMLSLASSPLVIHSY